MSAEDLRGIPVAVKDQPSVSLTDGQLDVLRLLGKGNSFKVKDVTQQLNLDAEAEMGGIYASLGVTGERAAVVYGLKTGILTTAELIDDKFDWHLMDRLKPQHKALLEVYTNAKDEELTDEEYKGLSAKTTQSKKRYIESSEEAICNHLKVGNITVAVVHYIEFKERQQDEVSGNSPIKNSALTDREKQILDLLGKGIPPPIVAQRCSITLRTVNDSRRTALRKLSAADLSQVIAKKQGR